MTTETQPVSPRLAALQQEIDAGNTAALDGFWQEVSRQGTPLIEPIPGDGEHSLVTFIWRAGHTNQEVAVVSALPGRDSTEALVQIRQLAGHLSSRRLRSTSPFMRLTGAAMVRAGMALPMPSSVNSKTLLRS